MLARAEPRIVLGLPSREGAEKSEVRGRREGSRGFAFGRKRSGKALLHRLEACAEKAGGLTAGGFAAGRRAAAPWWLTAWCVAAWRAVTLACGAHLSHGEEMRSSTTVSTTSRVCPFPMKLKILPARPRLSREQAGA